MLSRKQDVRTVVLCGSAKLGKTFMFEIATNWAMEGRQVVYISPVRLESMPATCHDRNDPASYAFAPSLKLIRFMYLSDYEALVEQLVNLHTFACVPSVLIIDDIDNYLKSDDVREELTTHTAKTCALILDTMNSCSKTLAADVYVYVWSSSILIYNPLSTMYFRNVWCTKKDKNKKEIVLQEVRCNDVPEQDSSPQFRYQTFQDGSRMLKQILYNSID